MSREITLGGWLRQYWVGIFAVLVVVYLSAHFYMISMHTKSTEASIQKNVAIVQEDIEDSLESIDKYFYESLYSNSDEQASQLFYALSNEEDPLRLLTENNKVLTALKSVVTWSDMADFVLVCTQRDDGLSWLEFGTDANYPSRRTVRQYISEKYESGDLDDLQRYMVLESPRKNMMLRVLKIENSFIIICVSEAEILQMLEYARHDTNGIVFAAKSDGMVIASSSAVTIAMDPENEGEYVTVNGRRYLQTGYISARTGYYFGILTERSTIMDDVNSFSLLYLAVFAVLLVIIPVMFALTNKYVAKPINAIAGTMMKSAEGDLDVTVDEQSKISELGQLVRSFNHMISRIKQLKIEKYESQLATQKATLQYLQLQIKPHFYANMFNIIFSLAQRKDYETIQKVSQAIVQYSRYMFADASQVVELQRELGHVRDYLEIQEIRYMMELSCTIDAPEELGRALIPPFAIQSFVENSVKYSSSSMKACRISVSVSLDETKEYLKMVIKDNGVGYSEELLHSDWKHENEDGHIGLSNVWNRLNLIYGEKADIQISNDNGAVTTLKIPYISVDNTAFDDE